MIDVERTHDLIGNRRSTVSVALEELCTTGTLTQTSNDRWMLNAPDILG